MPSCSASSWQSQLNWWHCFGWLKLLHRDMALAKPPANASESVKSSKAGRRSKMRKLGVAGAAAGTKEKLDMHRIYITWKLLASGLDGIV